MQSRRNLGQNNMEVEHSPSTPNRALKPLKMKGRDLWRERGDDVSVWEEH